MWAAWLVVAAFLSYSTSLNGGFVRDDVPCIVQNDDVRPSAPLLQPFLNDYWGTSIAHNHSHKSYRPLAIYTFRANVALHGLWPTGFRVTNLLLHIAASLALYRFAVLLSVRRRAAVAASFIFAVHPANSEAVMSIVGRADLLGTLGFGTAVALYLQTLRPTFRRDGNVQPVCGAVGPVAGAVASFAVAWVSIFAKETCIMFFPLAGALELLAAVHRLRQMRFRDRGGFRWVCCRILAPHALRILHAAAHALAALWLSRWLRGPMFSPGFSFDTNPVAFADAVTKLRTYALVHALYTHRVLVPAHLCADYAHAVLPLVQSWGDGRLLAVAAHAGLLLFASWNALSPAAPLSALARRAERTEGGSDACAPASVLPPGAAARARWILATCMLTAQLPLLPALGVGVKAGTVLAERLLYLPCAAACVAAAHAADLALRGSLPVASRARARRRRDSLVLALLAALAVAGAARTAARGYAWRDIDALLRATLEYRATSISSLHGLATADIARVSDALREEETECRARAGLGPADDGTSTVPDAVEAGPCTAQRAARARSQLVEAKAMILRALRVWHEWGTGYIELARIALLEDRRDVAKRLLEHGCGLSSPRKLRAAALRELAVLNMRDAQYGRAAYALSVAAQLQPLNPEGWFLTAHTEFERHRALVARSDDPQLRGAGASSGPSPAGRTMAVREVVKTDHAVAAVRALRRAAALAPDEPRYLRDLAVMMASSGATGREPTPPLDEWPVTATVVGGAISASVSVISAGDLAEPVRLLRRAAELDPADELGRLNYEQIRRAYERKLAKEAARARA